jgi:oxygen-independent coproporphyrinogen-3 oxidase
MLQQSIERLTEAGYEYIGMDHFAKPEDELAQALHNGSLYRNFQGYSTHAGLSMVALGASSISMLNDLYAQNTKDIKKYEESVRAGHLPIERGILLNDEDHIIRETIIEIMCRFQLNIPQWEDRYDKSFSDFFAPALDELNHMVDDGLVQVGGQGIVVSEKGRLLIRNIAMCFDSRLRKSSGGVQYSRTV